MDYTFRTTLDLDTPHGTLIDLEAAFDYATEWWPADKETGEPAGHVVTNFILADLYLGDLRLSRKDLAKFIGETEVKKIEKINEQLLQADIDLNGLDN